MRRAIVLAVCGLAAVGFAAQWHYLSGGRLSGISSVGSHVWTVGQDGLFFYSEDNGASWRRIPRFTTRNLVDIEFWDQGFGIATAEGDIIYRTTDNGGTWDSVHVQYAAGRVRFITRDCIWITGTNGSRILRSMDGGLSWPLSQPSWYSSWFLDSLNGWSSYQTNIFRTTDGGQRGQQSWQQVGEVPVPLGHDGIYCFGFRDSLRGVCAWHSSSVTPRWSSHFYGWSATSDGGASWDSLDWRVTPGVVCDVGPDGRLYGLEQRGSIVFGDFGYSRTPVSDLYELCDVSAARGERAWCCGKGGVAWFSADSGLTWSPARSQSGRQFWNLEFCDSLHGWAASSDQVARTEDGGRSWTLRAPDPDVNQISDIVALSENAAVVAAGWASYDIWEGWYGAFHFLTTADAGASWDAVRSFSYTSWDAPMGSSRIAHRGPRAWHAGVHATYNSLRSSDAGATWSDMDTLGAPGDGREPADISFIDTLNGWAIDSRSNIRRTTDAGDSWTIVAETLKVKRLEMLTLLKGCALSGSALVVTGDGGVSWDTVFTGARLRALHFCDSLCGAAVGDAGLLLRTDDGGETWVRDSSEFTSDLYAVFMLDSTRGWAAGENGLVLGFGDWAVGTDEAETPFTRGPGRGGFSVGPNPCRDWVLIEFSRPLPAGQSVYILDITGRKAADLHPGANDVRRLARGVYFVRTAQAQAQAQAVWKVVITR